MNPIDNQNICASCEQAIRHGVGRLDAVPGLIKRIIKEELWRERKVETGEIVKLKSFRELITAKPYAGWDTDPAKIEAVIRDDPEVLTLWEKEMQVGKGTRTDLVDNINHVRASKGTSRAYTASRLKRDRPDLFAKVVAGKLSANAAAIKAGFRKKKTALEQLNYWWGKASKEEREEFIKRT